jgi:NTE family protein
MHGGDFTMRTEAVALWKAAQAFWSRWQGNQPAGQGVGLALGGGFARGIAHVGVLRVLEREGIPVDCVAGVSAGSIVAAIFAGGAGSPELEEIARQMKFKDVAGWKLSKMGLVGSERMEAFLRRVLRVHRFERMVRPLAVVATDLQSGEPVLFHGSGEVFTPVRASCSYPGLFLPVRHNRRHLVDGAMSMEIPAQALHALGISRVISVALPPPQISAEPTSVFAVVNRCFQIMQRRTEQSWRRYSDLVITPQVSGVAWDDFSQVDKLIAAGVQAAEAALPAIRRMLGMPQERVVPKAATPLPSSAA